ncbi:MAG: alpha/beta fold hydrolase [Pseudomonadota bacterium]
MSHSLPPDRVPPTVTLDHLELDSGECLAPVTIAYELTGPVDAPVVAVMGGISATRHVASHAGDPAPGWWEPFVGAGKAVDTDQLRVLGMDFLGGNAATTGPRNSDGWPRALTPGDQARCVERLLDAQQIDTLGCFIGSSYGGMVALQLAAQAPGRLHRAAVLGAAHRPPAMATALRCIQREAVRAGLKNGQVRDGLRLARAIGMATYRSNEEFETRFDPAPAPGEPLSFAVEDYLFSRGDAFADAFDPQAYLTLSSSIDSLRVEPERIGLPVHLLAFATDFVAPPTLMQELEDRLTEGHLTTIPSIYGHDAFLKEEAAISQWLQPILCNV